MDLSAFARHPGLKDRTVFVTGGGSGVGKTIVECFLDQGSRVAFVDIAVKPSRALCKALKERYGRAPLFMRCDLRDIPALRKAIARTKAELGDIGVLVNNAANDQRHKWEDVTPAFWDEQLAINLKPMFFAIQAVAPQMKRLGGGAIVNVGSINWKLAMGSIPAYTTAEAQVHDLTRRMARDLGAHGVRVNTAALGRLTTKRQLKLWIEKKAEKPGEEVLRPPIHAKPLDLALLVLFLASEDARMCTAQEFTVAGGWV